jgi:hypothetical protein
MSLEFNEDEGKVTIQALMLDFRQFATCFSLCTKSQLRERVCAMLGTYEDKDKKVSFYVLEKTIKGLCKIAPQNLKALEQPFLGRVDKFLATQEGGANTCDLFALLGDKFIYELSFYVRTDAPDIMARTVSRYFESRGETNMEEERIGGMAVSIIEQN